MSPADWTALLGFLALFGILIIRVPVGIAMGLVGVGGFGVIVVMVVELDMISPPVGMNVFVIKSTARDTSLMTIYRGVMPFGVTDLLRLGLLILIPALAMWLPGQMR